MRLIAARACVAALVLSVATLRADELPRATPESVGMSSQRLARIADALKNDIDNGRMPGAVIAIARKGKLVYYEAFGFLDKAKGTPMPKDAIFSIASMTKPVVAAAALTFSEENRLLVHEPVGTYLPALKKLDVAVFRSGTESYGREPARRQPTIQDLMRHTAGFTYGNQGTTALHKAYPGASGNVADTMTGAEFIDALARLPLHYQPGTRWDYSYGLDILGIALESVAKQPLGRVLQDRIFRPLRMNDTAFTVPPEKVSRLARALPVDPVTGQPQSIRDQTKPWGFECGGGCLTSTAVDYLRFAQMLLNRGALDGTRVLGRKTVEYMTADHLGPEVDASRLHNFPVEHIDGYGFGLGVAVRRVPGVAGIMGSPGDYRWSGAQGTLFWVDPKEELAVVYMAQTPGAIRAHYRQVIATLVQQAIVD
ncbi:MAG TPA: serine hydrolase domain-containing protein [Vicinamibacterales bacterium]|nr:serine hydrolase domain-containing protein [Vicinamibacterales bacterium]